MNCQAYLTFVGPSFGKRKRGKCNINNRVIDCAVQVHEQTPLALKIKGSELCCRFVVCCYLPVGWSHPHVSTQPAGPGTIRISGQHTLSAAKVVGAVGHRNLHQPRVGRHKQQALQRGNTCVIQMSHQKGEHEAELLHVSFCLKIKRIKELTNSGQMFYYLVPGALFDTRHRPKLFFRLHLQYCQTSIANHHIEETLLSISALNGCWCRVDVASPQAQSIWRPSCPPVY